MQVLPHPATTRVHTTGVAHTRPTINATTANTCPEGQHAVPLRTSIVSASGYSLRLLPTDREESWLELEVPLSSFSQVLPLIVNNGGALTHSVLNTKRFLLDWANLSSLSKPGENLFACPGSAVSMQCGDSAACGNNCGSGGSTKHRFRSSAPNALMVASSQGSGIIVDIYDVALRGGDSVVLRLRWQPNPILVPESSGCHSHQDMQDAHYHQLPGCGAQLANQLDGLLGEVIESEMVLFMKLVVVCTPSTCSAGEGYDTTTAPNCCTPCDAGTYSAGGTDSCQQCDAGYYSASSGSSSCTQCNAGEVSGAGETSCNQCSPGSYSDSPSTCTQCDAGSYSSNPSTCTQCDAGSYSASSGSSSCTPCSAGEYSDAGATSCTPCSAGEYSDAGATSCTQCSAGEYSDAGATSCTQCSAGHYSYAGMALCLPCNAGEFSEAGATSCTQCSDGEYSEAAGSSTCTPCSAGYFSSAGSSSCTQCIDGTYSDTGAASCTQCAAGTYSFSGSSSCTQCAAGEFSEAGATSCTQCSDGEYSEAAGSSTCTQCNAGYFSSAGSSSCTQCIDGTYSDTGAASCTQCLAGEYSFSGSSSCTQCNAGEYSSSSGSSSCTQCNAGEYCDVSGCTSCNQCAAGTYSDTGSTVCTNCAAGTSSNATGATSDAVCVECDPGYYSDVGSSECTACDAGTYSDNAGSTVCTDCAAGTYSNTTGTTICTQCDLGMYSNTTGSTFCNQCLPGTYADDRGFSNCTACPPGSYTDTPGSSIYTICDAGKYSDVPGSSSCISCPAGTSNSTAGASTSSSCSQCNSGEYSGAGATSCLPCAAGYYAASTGSSSCTACASGTTSSAGASSCSPSPSSPSGPSFTPEPQVEPSPPEVSPATFSASPSPSSSPSPSPSSSPSPSPSSSPSPNPSTDNSSPEPLPPVGPGEHVVPQNVGIQGFDHFSARSSLGADQVAFCKSLMAAVDYPLQLLECTVDGMSTIPGSNTKSVVAVEWSMLFNVKDGKGVSSADKQAAALEEMLSNPVSASAIFASEFPNNPTTTISVSVSHVVQQAQVTSPPPKRPGCPRLTGTYKLVANGRSKCSTPSPLLSYYGGNKQQCTKTSVVVMGKGKKQYAVWTFSELADNTTKIVASGRQCPAASKATTILIGNKKNALAELAPVKQNYRWRVVRVAGKCDVVNLISTKSAAAMAPAYLSTSANCSDTAAMLATKDDGSGHQRWKLVRA